MIVIYHSADLDGMCSGAICKKKYPDATLIGYDYGQEFPWDKVIDNSTSRNVLMVDVSLNMPDMLKLAAETNLVWIDHHISANKAWKEFEQEQQSIPFINVCYQEGIAACELTWMYLFPDEPMPEAVQLLGMYDNWRQNEPAWNWGAQILPFQYGMRLQCQSAETFNQQLLDSSAKPFVSIGDIMTRGEAILIYQRQQDKLAMRRAFECGFQGLRAIVCNLSGAGSLAFESVYDPAKHDIMVGFGFNRDKWTFSLRTTHEHVDCSVIAKQFGGGGHKKAAGFTAKLEDVLKLPTT